MIFETEAVKVSIDASFDEVVRFLGDPAKAHEVGTEFFAGPLRRATGDEWAAQVPLMGGEVRYRQEVDLGRGLIDIYMAPKGGDFGPPLPVRVLHNGDGADVIWTLLRFPGTADEAWEGGIASMGRELQQLKRRFEAGELS